MKRVVTKHVHVNTILEDIKDKDRQEGSGTDSVYTQGGKNTL